MILQFYMESGISPQVRIISYQSSFIIYKKNISVNNQILNIQWKN